MAQIHLHSLFFRASCDIINHDIDTMSNSIQYLLGVCDRAITAKPNANPTELATLGHRLGLLRAKYAETVSLHTSERERFDESLDNGSFVEDWYVWRTYSVLKVRFEFSVAKGRLHKLGAKMEALELRRQELGA